MNYAFFSKDDLADGTKAGIVIAVADLADVTAARAYRDALAEQKTGRTDIGQLFGYMEASLRVLAVGDQVYPKAGTPYSFYEKMKDGSQGALLLNALWRPPVAAVDPTADNPDGVAADPGMPWPLDISPLQVIATPAGAQ